MPGRCGRRLAGLDAEGRPRYCKRYPLKGRDCCKRCGGKALRGPAHPGYRGRGRSKWDGVLPANLARHVDLSNLEAAASCREELALVDARVAEVLESINAADVTGQVGWVRAQLGLLGLALEAEDMGAARLAAQSLASMLDLHTAVASGWDELHRLFDTRAKLSRAELGWQKLQAERIMAADIAAFVRALIVEARLLTTDRQKLSAYVTRVCQLGSEASGITLPDVVDAEFVEEEPG
jgi:hypothetical protein